ncbi:MAG: hypothetical protein JWQ29_573 [Phenylobacterium sp.]|nr:hypothetical protein [Phenylobacterium sp.]
MFEGWDSYYLMVGSSAGALIGLLFVVATLTTNLGHEQAARGAAVYMTPTVFHLGVVLVLSCVTAVPGMTPQAAGWLVGVGGLAGLGYATFSTAMIQWGKEKPPHWSDVWYYGAAPFSVHLGLVAAGVAIGCGVSGATYGLAALLVALLVVAIRNAWDLVTWLAPSTAEKP